MKSQEMTNEEMKKILEQAQEGKLTNPLYREYLVGLTNTLLGSVSTMVFINTLQGIPDTKLTKQDIRQLLPREYEGSLTDYATSVMLDSIGEYYSANGYQVVTKQNLENQTIELHITVI